MKKHSYRFTPGADLDAKIGAVLGRPVSHSWRAATDEQEGAFVLYEAGTDTEVTITPAIEDVVRGHQPVDPAAHAQAVRDGLKVKVNRAANLAELKAVIIEWLDAGAVGSTPAQSPGAAR